MKTRGATGSPTLSFGLRRREKKEKTTRKSVVDWIAQSLPYGASAIHLRVASTVLARNFSVTSVFPEDDVQIFDVE
jgi:hypothetical protein